MASYTRVQLEDWVKTLDAKGNVLDIGGSQNPVRKRLRFMDETDYKILDLINPHEFKETPDLIGDLNDEIEAKDYDEYFDVAFCLEVSEYLYNPFLALKNINKLLRKGGLLYMSFHFVYPVHSPKAYDYLRYTPQGVERLLSETGFEVLNHKKRVAERNGMQMFYLTERMRPAEGADHQIIGSLITARKI